MNATYDGIIEYIREKGHYSTDIDENTKLFSSGMIDSFFMVELIMYLETAEDFRIPPEAITLENLDTVGSMLAYCRTQSQNDVRSNRQWNSDSWVP